MAALSRKISTSRAIVLRFALLIMFGALLLCLPVSASSGKGASFADALFTSVSAVCVTGLTVVDTGTAWSGFGQAVILFLIQTGGMGVITVVVTATVVFNGNVSLKQRSIMQEAISCDSIGDTVRTAIGVIRNTFIVECAGALMLMIPLCRDYGLKGVWYSVFHSVSAFCNAGFDLMGAQGQASLSSYVSSPLVNTVIMTLIITGGIGFVCWDDIRKNGVRVRRYRLHTKAVIITTAVLIIVSFILFFFLEFSSLPLPERIWASLFQSVTPRTAGFYTTDQAALSCGGKMLTIALMLIGGAPGSTAGGMKVTTVAVIFACMLSVFRKRNAAQMLGRRISDDTLRSALALFTMYLSGFLAVGAAISRIEALPLSSCLFEAASALGTVGLSTGITPSLSGVSRILLMMLMFAGRAGGLTLMFSALSGSATNVSKLPLENINVG